MCRALYLTEHNSELERVYKIGDEILTYKTINECEALIRLVLSNPEWAMKVRNAGHARALSEHTWDHRFSRIFEMTGIMTKSGSV